MAGGREVPSASRVARDELDAALTPTTRMCPYRLALLVHNTDWHNITLHPCNHTQTGAGRTSFKKNQPVLPLMTLFGMCTCVHRILGKQWPTAPISLHSCRGTASFNTQPAKHEAQGREYSAMQSLRACDTHKRTTTRHTLTRQVAVTVKHPIDCLPRCVSGTHPGARDDMHLEAYLLNTAFV